MLGLKLNHISKSGRRSFSRSQVQIVKTLYMDEHQSPFSGLREGIDSRMAICKT